MGSVALLGHLCVVVLQTGLNQHPYAFHVVTSIHTNSPTTNSFQLTTAVPTVLFAVHVYIPLLLLTTGLMVRTDLLTPSGTGTQSFRNV